MSCSAPTVIVGGVIISTNIATNAQTLLNTVSNDQGDPTLDEYTENIANGNNTKGSTGVQFNDAVQTSLPTPSPIPGTDANTTAPPGLPGTPGVCVPWNGSYDTQLSANFKLRAFTINAVFPYQLTDYLTFSKDTRFCNLCALALNIAEPMLTKFGSLNINSGLRNKTSTPTGISQHISGEAIDIQFSGWNYQKYWDNAAWVKDNIPYDQFIFEHSSTTGLAWYHLSFSRTSSRAPGARDKVMTMFRNHYDPGLHKHG